MAIDCGNNDNQEQEADGSAKVNSTEINAMPVKEKSKRWFVCPLFGTCDEYTEKQGREDGSLLRFLF